MSKNDVKNLSFEEALAELETIVRQLESGNKDLQSSIDAYERGVLLKKHCESRLKDAQMKIEKISISDNGMAQTAPFTTAE